MCSIPRDPRRFEYTICTAVASLAVRTVRTYGDMTDRLPAPGLVHNPPTKTPNQRALHHQNRRK